MTTAMDFYLSTDSISLQEMLDIDIKSEIDTLVGGHNDLAGFNFSDLPPLELDESPTDFNRWFSSNSNHSNSSFNADYIGSDAGSTLVNPNTVMPIGSSTNLAQSIRSPSPTLKQSHLTFSPSTIKIGTIKCEPDTVKRDLMISLEEKKPIFKTTTTTTTKVTPILAKPSIKTLAKSSPTLLTFKSAVPRQLPSPITVAHMNGLMNGGRTISHGRKQQFNNNRIFDEDERTFPKPAYSYSCLIAMALKNSRTGSLPVSEIYNFMCQHFPYFKTAPNGWKNSVRHNLSLNKCFEKIEKPALSGAQRKGCLWAMNPAKISKMDEEVQKWSRKDPNAIRKAMVNPDHLESLERGELKYTCSLDGEIDNFGDSCGSAESEEASDSDGEPDTTMNGDADAEFIDVSGIPNDDGNDYDIEVTETMYDDLSDDQELLRVEMALAQKELMEYERSVNNKRKKIAYVIQN